LYVYGRDYTDTPGVQLRSLVVNSKTGQALHEFDWNDTDDITVTHSGNTWTISNTSFGESLTLTLSSPTAATAVLSGNRNGISGKISGIKMTAGGDINNIHPDPDTDSDTGNDTNNDTDNDTNNDTGSNTYSYEELEIINNGVEVEANSSGKYVSLPSGSVVSSVSNSYENILDAIVSGTKDTSSSLDSTSAARKITVSMNQPLPYGTIVLLAFAPVDDTNDNGTYYAVMLHSGKAGGGSSSVVIDTSKIYDPQDTSTRVRFPAGTYTVAFSTLDAIAGSSELLSASGLKDLKAAAGTSGNLGEISLAAPSSGNGGSSSGCDLGLGLSGLLIFALALKLRKK
ncbi:MAG: hypothetical protein IJ520_07465, partial [Synergistaceae bacterium]|nr:hypothetical protein [Synergistaceae bacterium]